MTLEGGPAHHDDESVRNMGYTKGPISWTPRRARIALVALSVGMLISSTSALADEPTDLVTIEVRSTRADLVSGGDALVRIVLPPEAAPASLVVDLNESDITDRFAVRPNGHLEGIVAPLLEGDNSLVVHLPDGSGARMTITNHPASGPLFSGPPLQPWSCRPEALDERCSRATTFEYFYMSLSSGSFQPYGPDGPQKPPGNGKAGLCGAIPGAVWDAFPYSDSGYVNGACERTPANPLPEDPLAQEPDESDVATTKTDEGKTVPYIVRLETGIVDRDRYQVAVLFDPDEPWDRWAPQDAWNRKLVISHGHGCGATYGQGEELTVLEEQRALSKGYAVMNTALNNSGSNCNPVVQAESMVMAKEHVIETYGDVLFTMGSGGSGGALAQQWVANAYPGIYDGLLLGQSFPDAWSTTMEMEDCALLLEYWQDPTRWAPGVAWTEAQKAGVEGHLSTSVCQENVTVAGFNKLFQPAVGRSCTVPAAMLYNPSTNPSGVRCSLQDYTVNVLGVRPPELWTDAEEHAGRGFAGRPYDNVGVQYGLAALRAGTITPAQFVDLNRAIGAHDLDYAHQGDRVAADAVTLARAYRAGLVNEANNLDLVPIIDKRGTNTVEIHHHVRTWEVRERLDRANGHHENHVVWWGPVTTNGDSTFSSAAFDLLSQWITAIKADATEDPLDVKVVRNKPAGAVDRCTDGRGGPADPRACEVPDGTPRMQAGGPLADDVLTCELTPLDRTADYGPLPFTDAEWTQLQALFSGGVCDYSRTGVGQQPAVAWLTYEAGPGGVPLGDAPRSDYL